MGEGRRYENHTIDMTVSLRDLTLAVVQYIAFLSCSVLCSDVHFGVAKICTQLYNSIEIPRHMFK